MQIVRDRSPFGRRIGLSVAALVAAVLCGAPSAQGDDFPAEHGREGAGLDWTQWRGPARDGTVPGEKWPESLDENRLKRAWRVELGPSYSGPIVAAGRVFTTETVDEKFERVRAFSLADGAPLWSAQWDGAMDVPFFARRNGSWIRSTPAYDDGALYVGGIRDVLVRLNAETGAIDWRADLRARFDAALPDFGFASSPLVVGEHLYVQAGGGFLKLRKDTGETVWRTLADGGGMWGSAFSSPVMETIAGREQLLVQTRKQICGVDPATGEVLWSHDVPAFRGMNILTPTVYNDGIFTSTYQNKSFYYTVAADAAGKLSVRESWTGKPQGYMGSPVVVGDFAYLHLRNQRVSCIDLRTGEEAWRTSERFGEYWSSIVQGDRILALDQNGELLLIQADPTGFKPLSRRRVAEAETWAHVAVADGKVMVRELHALAAWDWK